LKVLRGKIQLSACSKRKLRIYKKSSQGRGLERIPLRHAEVYKRAGRFLSPAVVWYTADSRWTFIPLELTMLHKMYVASSKVYKKLTATKKPPSKIKRKLPHSDFDKWIEMSRKLREEDVIRKAQLKIHGKVRETSSTRTTR
jgi:hypothetical protein